MRGRASVALGVAGGYFLGRRQKMKLALILGSAAAGLGMGGRAHTLSTSLADEPPAKEAPQDDAGELGSRAADAAAQARTDGDLAASSETSETVVFNLDGHQYRLDLSTEDAVRLRESLAPYVAVARLKRTKGRTRRGGTSGPG